MDIEWKYLWIWFGRDLLRGKDCNFGIMLLPKPDLREPGSLIPHLLRIELSWNWPKLKMFFSHIPRKAYKK